MADYYESRHTGQIIDDAVDRAKVGGVIDMDMQKKAPAGYGLGTNAKDISGVDFNTVIDNGWYMFATAGENRPFDNMGYSYMLVAKRNNENLTQIVFIGNASDYAGCIIKRVNLSGTWYPWEWVNPPMYLGVEYRTTERYLGKPVYTQLVDCGKMVTGKLTYTHGISNIQYCVRCNMVASDNPNEFNGSTTLPSIHNPTKLDDRWNIYPLGFGRTGVSMYCGGGLANCSVYATVWYTKSTD